MKENQPTSSRKQDHIRINLIEDVRSGVTTGLERYRFIHEALPEINLDEVNLAQMLFGKKVSAPILISSMTGGTPKAGEINRILAEAAQATGVVMGLGSQRIAFEHPEQKATFQVRKYAPDIVLFANLGAVQLNYNFTVDHCREAVDMIEADALILHLNSLQEALQPEGDTHFAGLLRKIETVCRHLPVPVIAKEVGWGISERAARMLVNAGVSVIDVAGAGGTTFAQVEMYRMDDESMANVAAAFRDWGIPTAESLKMVRKAAPEVMLFASGGLRDGLDIAKCIALGACLGGMAGPFLKAAAISVEATINAIAEFRQEIRLCMFGVGADSITALQRVELIEI